MAADEQIDNMAWLVVGILNGDWGGTSPDQTTKAGTAEVYPDPVFTMFPTKVSAMDILTLIRQYNGKRDGVLTWTLEAGNKKSKFGLDLNVLDHYSGTERPVNTLSGGESFMASLSLALGLSDEVQASAGGIKLDTMFIDEGFGSLDSECIDDAMSILHGVQKSHGLVGIISHVEKLSEIIPTRLEVVTSADGNHINPIIP